MNQAVRVVNLMIIGVLLTPIHTSAKSMTPHIIITSQENGIVSENEFRCDGTIHIYITFPEAIEGKHLLEGVLKDSKGTPLEHTRVNLNYPPPGRRTATLWLQFDTKSDGLLGSVRSGDIKSKPNTYNGMWELEILFDGDVVGRSRFQVGC